MSDDETKRYAFDCPACGETIVITTADDPEDVVNNIYECGACGEHIQMAHHEGERPDQEADDA